MVIGVTGGAGTALLLKPTRGIGPGNNLRNLVGVQHARIFFRKFEWLSFYLKLVEFWLDLNF